MYDYYLGGKDNFAADRELGDRTLQAYPNLVFSVRANRAFLARTVRFLAAEAGIRQFADIGTGIPTASRIVYVDNDRCKSGCDRHAGPGQAAARRYAIFGTALSRSVRAARPNGADDFFTVQDHSQRRAFGALQGISVTGGPRSATLQR